MSSTRPQVMASAKEDLSGHLQGRFSPEDWQLILERAEHAYREREPQVGAADAWASVVRDFHTQKQWGFRADYKAPPKPKAEGNLGLRFIVMALVTFTISKIAVVWLGQVYTRSEDPIDTWLFLGSIVLVICNFGYFLWRVRHHKD